MTWTETVELYLAEGRTVSGGKGKGTAKGQMEAQTQMQKQAFLTQQKQIADLQKSFSPYTSTAGIGYDPATLAAMNTGAMNTNAQQFQSAGQGVREALLARGSGGGNLPVGGDYVRGISSLMGARASDLSSQLNNIRLQNASQALTNKFNAGNLLSGNAATLTGTQGVAGAAASNALNQYISAANTGFGSSFMNAFGGSLGKGLGSFATGGIGKGITGLTGFGG